MGISGRTGLLALIGNPVAHSGSPAMHTYSCEKTGQDYVYLAFEVKKEETKKAFESLKFLNVKGFNITMPCKTEAALCCDELSKAAEMIGAVNAVVNENGRMIGHNTDGIGWIWSCRREGVEIIGKKMTLLGSGGAAISIAIATALEGIRELSVFARKGSASFANAEKAVEKIRIHVPGCTVNLYDLADKESFKREVADSDILTNATNVGMKPEDDKTLVEDTSVFHKNLVVADVIYNPRKTRLILDAEQAGCKTVPGIGMLAGQGAEAFRLFTGATMPVEEVMERFFR